MKVKKTFTLDEEEFKDFCKKAKKNCQSRSALIDKFIFLFNRNKVDLSENHLVRRHR